MTQPVERDPIYRGRRFQTETIELCVRWAAGISITSSSKPTARSNVAAFQCWG